MVSGLGRRAQKTWRAAIGRFAGRRGVGVAGGRGRRRVTRSAGAEADEGGKTETRPKPDEGGAHDDGVKEGETNGTGFPGAMNPGMSVGQGLRS
jgi:hypothetical protein